MPREPPAVPRCLVLQRASLVTTRPPPVAVFAGRLATKPKPKPTCAAPRPASVTRRVPPQPVVTPKPRLTTQRRNAISRKVARGVSFYLVTAALIVVGVTVHEYSHYAAHEGLSFPDITYSASVEEAQRDLLRLERSRGAGADVLVHQPEATTIVIYPNTFLQAAGLGLIPEPAYQDDGVLASTFFHLEPHEVRDLQARNGAMPDGVVAAPVWVALAIFAVALAWTLARPSLFSKALLVAYAVQLGDAGHHAGALGIEPMAFYAFSTLALALAGILLVLRRRRTAAPVGQAPAAGTRPAPSPASKPQGRPAWPMSVRRATDNSTTWRPPQSRPA